MASQESSQSTQQHSDTSKGTPSGGEGKAADAVKNQPGGGGTDEEFASEIDRKKAEQAPLREKIIQEREEKVDVEAALEKGAPAAG